MDAASFDRLSRLFVATPSRRTLGGLVLGSIAGLLGLTEVEAAPCPKGKQRCGTRCIPRRHCCTTANCRPATTGKVCRRRRCVCPASKQRCRNRCIPKAACCGGCLPRQVCQAGTSCYPTTEAFRAALAPGGPATIQLCAGAAYLGQFLLQRSVTVVGAGPTRTILNGSGTSRVVDVVSGVTVELRGLQLTNGRAGSAGGGLRVDQGATVTLRRCLVRGNTATSPSGGGGFLSVGTLTLIDTVVSGNPVGGSGGGLVSNGVEASTLILRGATRIEGNEASVGGGLFAGGNLTRVELREGSIVTGNEASPGNPISGGGIFNDASAPAQVLFFDRNRVTATTPNNCTGVTCPS
jgi:hypothetical protein